MNNNEKNKNKSSHLASLLKKIYCGALLICIVGIVAYALLFALMYIL